MGENRTTAPRGHVFFQHQTAALTDAVDLVIGRAGYL
jgi:hypothetical protein